MTFPTTPTNLTIFDDDRTIVNREFFSMSERRLCDVLRPLEKPIMRVQEVLLLKRPFIFVGFLLIILSVASSIRSWECGFFAGLMLIVTLVYSFSVAWVCLGDRVEKYLFKELPPEKITQNPPLHSFEELCEIIEIHFLNNKRAEKQQNTIVLAAVCFALAFLFYFINPFYFNVGVAILLLFTPFIVSQPAVLKIFHGGKLPRLATPSH